MKPVNPCCYLAPNAKRRPPVLQLLQAGIIIALSFAANGFVFAAAHENYESALQSFNQRKLDYAYIHLKNALQADPGHLPSRVLMAELQIARGNPAGAEDQLHRARKMGADDKRITPLLIKAYVLQQQYDKALTVPLPEDLSQVVASDIQVQFGDAHVGMDDLKAADAAYTRAAELIPSNVSALLGLAQVSTIDGRSEAAFGYTSQVLRMEPGNPPALLLQAINHQYTGNVPEGLVAVNQLMIINPDNLSTRMTRALLLIDSGDLSGALTDIDFILEKNPSDPVATFMQYILYVDQNRLEESKAVLADLGVSLASIPQAFTERFPIYHYLAGLTSFQQGEYHTAAAALLRYSALIGDDLKTLKLLAQVQLALGDSDSARQALEKADQLAPDNPVILTLLGDAHSNLGETEQALAHYRKAIDLQPGAARPVAALAKLYLQVDQPSQAIALLQQPADIADDPNTLALMVRAKMAVGDLRSTLTYARKLLALMPNQSDVHGLAGSILALSGELEQAKISYRKALKLDGGNQKAVSGLAQAFLREENPAKALSVLRDFRDREGNNPALLVEIGDVHRVNNDLAKATFWYKKARSIEPEYRPAVQRMVDLWVGSGDLTAAIAVTEEYLLLAPDDTEVLGLAARLYLSASQPEDAMIKLERLARLSPDKSQPLLSLANVQLEAGRPDEARGTLLKAITWNANLVPAYLRLIDMATVEKDPAEALRLIEQLEVAGKDKALANRLKGSVYEREGQYDKAIAYYLDSLKVTPSTQATMGLFEIYKARRQNDLAIALLADWVNLNPRDMLAAINLAELHHELRQLDKSAGIYDSLLSRFPQNAVVLNNAAFVQLEQGNMDEAARLASLAYRRAPQSSLIMDTRAWIETQRGNYDVALPLLRQASEMDFGNADIKYHLAVTLDKLERHDEAKLVIAQISPGQVNATMRRDVLSDSVAQRLAETFGQQ